MAYVPPPPGSTEAGKPTPEGVTKQDVHITDLPPEVRKSFLLSMVFFPSMVGAAICVVMFLGWIAFFRPKEPMQYALELDSSDMRRRWTAARELAEHITPYGELDSARVYAPETLTALIKILENPDLDKEADVWSPSASIKQDKEKNSIRWYAAFITGHIGAKMKDPADRERAFQALMKALEEKSTLALYAAKGLSFMGDTRACDALAQHLESDANPAVRWASAEALGAIGGYQMTQKNQSAVDKIQLILANQYQRENAKSEKDDSLISNLAVALARLHDSTGIARLHEMEASEDPSEREIARRTLEFLKEPLPK